MKKWVKKVEKQKLKKKAYTKLNKLSEQLRMVVNGENRRNKGV